MNLALYIQALEAKRQNGTLTKEDQDGVLKNILVLKTKRDKGSRLLVSSTAVHMALLLRFLPDNEIAQALKFSLVPPLVNQALQEKDAGLINLLSRITTESEILRTSIQGMVTSFFNEQKKDPSTFSYSPQLLCRLALADWLPMIDAFSSLCLASKVKNQSFFAEEKSSKNADAENVRAAKECELAASVSEAVQLLIDAPAVQQNWMTNDAEEATELRRDVALLLIELISNPTYRVREAGEEKKNIDVKPERKVISVVVGQVKTLAGDNPAVVDRMAYHAAVAISQEKSQMDAEETLSI